MHGKEKYFSGLPKRSVSVTASLSAFISMPITPVSLRDLIGTSGIGQASGFISERDGVVITNYHIISNSAWIKGKAARYRVLVGSFSDKAKAIKTSRVIFKKEKLESVIYRH